MDITIIDKLCTSFEQYNKRKKELSSKPATIDIFEDGRLKFCAEQVESNLKKIVIIDPPVVQKHKQKQSKKKR